MFLARFDPLNLELHLRERGTQSASGSSRREQYIHWLKPTAPAIGLAELFHPRIDSVRLSQGDSLLLYTDGVTEVVNAAGDEQFGYLRLADLLSQHAHQNAPDILQTVYRGVSAFGNNRSLADDVTMVALKVLG